MLHIKLSITHDDGTELDGGLLPLLQAISHDGAITKAAQRAGLSYRHAWGLVREWERRLGHDLVRKSRGKGTRLTTFGARLLEADVVLRRELTPSLDTAGDALNQAMKEFVAPRAGRRHVSVFASHGLAIGYLHELLRDDGGIDVDFETHGSFDSLRALDGGQCQAAGFHLPLEAVGRALAPAYARWLSDSRHHLLLVAIREQGLICRGGNPKKLRDLADLTRRTVRFVNRQRFSGTRTIFDQLLADRQIDPKEIHGYADEEFTHNAVAALVASGAADAGFGIRAVVDPFGLDFIPFLREAYVLAIARETDPVITDTIATLLASTGFRDKVGALAGIDVSRSGERLTTGQLLS